MQYDANQALVTLQTTGRVCLQGEPALWSKATSVLIKVLLGLVALLLVGLIAGFIIAVASGMGISFGLIFGLVGGLAMTVALGALILLWQRKRTEYRDQELQPVVLESTGLTLRGVGPIPWQDFGRAEYRMVVAEHDSGYTRRAVMPLTESGLYNVNQLLAPELREQISPAAGPIWNRSHANIYVPGIEGMKNHDVMWLINSGREFFLGR